MRWGFFVHFIRTTSLIQPVPLLFITLFLIGCTNAKLESSNDLLDLALAPKSKTTASVNSASINEGAMLN